jgi:hypothetical protein
MSRMAPRTAPLHLRCAESSTPAGSPIAAINAHSGRGVVRPPRSFLAHRPLGRLFFRFAGPIACSRQQRPRFAQPLARRRMAAQRFCRLLTLSDLISAISEPVLRSVFGFALAPLRGSWRQQPCGAAVSAAMVAPCADEVLRAAVADRRSVPCHLRGGGSVAVCRSLEGRATHAPAHPAPLARGIANALPSLPSPPQGWRSRVAKGSPPHHRENLGPLKWGLRGFGRRGRLWAKRRGRIWAQGGFGLARCARIWVRSFGICHLFVTGTYFHPFFRTLLERLTPYLSEKCAPRDSNPEPID